MQAVERGEQVEQRHPGGAPGEEPKGPGESQEQGEAGHALQVPQQTAADACWPVGPHATDLHQHHPKHLQRERERERPAPPHTTAERESYWRMF